MSGTNAIETRAGGQTFRSRLEARWAMFFDKIGWRWTYEPFDADYYIPDFLIHGPKPLIVEVKPYATLSECAVEARRIHPLLEQTYDVLVVGLDPQIAGGWAGALVEQRAEIGVDGAPTGKLTAEAWWDGALWGWHPPSDCCLAHRVGQGCSEHWGVFSDGGSFALRPTGHYDGGRHWDSHESFLRDLWRQAGDEVKWLPKH